MAARRMFAISIIDSDLFLRTPKDAQLLYFHLAMRADDDGFVNNPFKIQKMVDASDEDMNELIERQFILPFDSGIVVIRHWKIHNYIQSDRYKETMCKAEKRELTLDENKAYTRLDTECIQTVSKMDTQVRLELGKGSLGKGGSCSYEDNLNTTQKTTSETTTTAEKNNIPTREEIESYCQVASISIDIDDFIEYNEMQGWKVKDWKAAVRRWKKNEARFEEKKKTKESKYNFDELQKKAFDNINKTSNKNDNWCFTPGEDSLDDLF